jgi:hypothetical protein
MDSFVNFVDGMTSGAADEDEAGTTVIDFVSAPLFWVDVMG